MKLSSSSLIIVLGSIPGISISSVAGGLPEKWPVRRCTSVALSQRQQSMFVDVVDVADEID